MRSLGVIVLIVLLPGIARAASGPKWTPFQLAQHADVVVTGTVAGVKTGWDRDVNAIYTYVTVNVREILKGNISARTITIKQLGGTADGVVLSVIDQPTFAIGEDVLLYLEARPRDGTLYTSALWQGKWNIEGGVRGDTAVRRAPVVHGDLADRQALGDARVVASDARHSTAGAATRIVTDAAAADAAIPRASAGFELLGPFRYTHVPAVDVQAGGQPGLSGGGLAQIQTAMQRWNSVGSSFRYAAGGNSAAPRCSSELLSNGRVTISFMDPCGEMSNTGGTLALGGSYYLPGEGGTSNGQAFDRAIEGFVINNDSPTALRYLTNPGCFEDIQTHELGHVLGLNHSADPDALMYPTIDSTRCWNGAAGLRADDVQGILFIYGQTPLSGATPPPVPPTDVRVSVQTTQLVVSWLDPTHGSTAPATSYRVDFKSGHADAGPIVASVMQAAPSLTVAIPPGVSGPYSVTVTGVNAAGAGPASPRQDFTIGASSNCSAAPPAPSRVAASISNGFARVRWSAVSGATRYLIQAGSSAGAADLFALTDLGASVEAGASVPPGFRAWVRVFAVNACGVSAPADVFLQ